MIKETCPNIIEHDDEVVDAKYFEEKMKPQTN